MEPKDIKIGLTVFALAVSFLTGMIFEKFVVYPQKTYNNEQYYGKACKDLGGQIGKDSNDNTKCVKVVGS